MQIRPHHLLCMGNFIGKGYSAEFTENMKNVISALKEGNRFILTDGGDDICRACPYNSDGVCKEQEKVSRYDAAAKTALSLEYGNEYNYNEILKVVNEKIYKTGKLKEICGNCEWAQICVK